MIGQRKTLPPTCQPAPSTKLSSIIYIMHAVDCVGTKQAMQQPSFSPYLYLPDFFLLTPCSEWSSLCAAFQPALGCKMPLLSNQLSPAPSLCPFQAVLCLSCHSPTCIPCRHRCAYIGHCLAGGLLLWVCVCACVCARAGRHICTKAWKADI